jgi:NAD/NADP transhydrogenase alpha subunit
MRVFVPREIESGESRVALLPEAAEKLTALGMEISVEAGLGAALSIPDEAYEMAGAELRRDRSGAPRLG